jgi:hypothetical protein
MTHGNNYFYRREKYGSLVVLLDDTDTDTEFYYLR